MSLTVGGQTDRIEKQLAEIEKRLDQAVLDRRRIEDTVNTHFDRLGGQLIERFDNLKGRFDRMEGRFDRLEELLMK